MAGTSGQATIPLQYVTLSFNHAIGYGVTNPVANSARVRGDLYLDGATGIYTRATFGSGDWQSFDSGSDTVQETYPVFRLPVAFGLELSCWTDFEIKASTNNFTNLVYYYQSWVSETNAYGDTNTLIYYTDDYAADVRVWQTAIHSQSIASQLVHTNSIVETVYFYPSHNCSINWETWMYKTNENLVWSWVRNDAVANEMNVDGTKQHWMPIRPDSWEVIRTTP